MNLTFNVQVYIKEPKDVPKNVYISDSFLFFFLPRLLTCVESWHHLICHLLEDVHNKNLKIIVMVIFSQKHCLMIKKCLCKNIFEQYIKAREYLNILISM